MNPEPLIPDLVPPSPVCGGCNGKGTLPDFERHLSADRFESVRIGEHPCNVCGGTGLKQDEPEAERTDRRTS